MASLHCLVEDLDGEGGGGRLRCFSENKISQKARERDRERERESEERAHGKSHQRQNGQDFLFPRPDHLTEWQIQLGENLHHPQSRKRDQVEFSDLKQWEVQAPTSDPPRVSCQLVEITTAHKQDLIKRGKNKTLVTATPTQSGSRKVHAKGSKGGC